MNEEEADSRKTHKIKTTTFLIFSTTIQKHEENLRMVRRAGLEPAPPAWKAGILPLDYRRMAVFSF